ncbi:aspartate aminotransferase [Phakopsora pachyrhizi]|uniref:Aspartate aminotransferase n=1 Tax=Phakopsora pachyrhizi TaxID=170000 RepID=A0AAV0BU24_PHAPC|nr:aspartate aminotransferase [Phakopsora pachyrhizi]CAH7690702.1 aspartate aminotransferase [Phakopsora pachyrhizi]
MSDQRVEAFSETPLAPPDAIFQLTAAYKADTFDKKVNLGVGAYRDNSGKPWVLPVVKQIKQELAQDKDQDHEYLPITGLPSFTKESSKLILGSGSPAISENRIASAQTISGTGANHLAGLFLAKFYKPWYNKPASEKVVYLSNPTWANHKAIFANLGLTTKDYPYYDPKTIGLDYQGFLNALKSAPPQSVFLLHACAHNPTGVDPTREQWKELAATFCSKGHYAFFDCAYQGFASGDLDNDAWAVRHFVEQKVPLLICQSFAKNAGLYGERIGCLSLVAKDEDEAKRIHSQISVLQRSEISNPPTYGARIVSAILNDPAKFEQWKKDVKTMADRIIDMRKKLRDLLENKHQTPGSWDHITKQIGMFSFTGLNPAQVAKVVEVGHIYMTGNGRISMAGLNTSNVEYVADRIDKAVRAQL